MSMTQNGTIGLGDLVRVGKGTPGGEWLRRYWLAVGTSEELRDIPRAVRVLGEELVLFRGEDGRATDTPVQRLVDIAAVASELEHLVADLTTALEPLLPLAQAARREDGR